MVRKTLFLSLLSFFAAPASAGAVLRLTSAEPVPVFSWNNVHFSHCSGALPESPKITRTVTLSRRDAKWLEATFKCKQPVSMVENLNFRCVRQFLLLIKKKSPEAILFECPSDPSKSFVVQITYNVTEDEFRGPSPKPWTDVMIYTTSEKMPKNILEFTKTCVLQRGWFRLNKYKTVVLAIVPVLFFATRLGLQALRHYGYVSPKMLAWREPRAVNNTEWDEWQKQGNSCSICCDSAQDGLTINLCPQPQHLFHQDCWDKWMGHKRSCPVCNAEIPGVRKVLCRVCNDACLFFQPSAHKALECIFPMTAGSFKSVYRSWCIASSIALAAAHLADLRSN